LKPSVEPRLQTGGTKEAKVGDMTQPIELTIEEPLPGAFVWRLLETDAQGESPRILRSAYDASENYETALSAGQRALQSEIRQRSVKANA
jgi:hypothetical protein